MGWLSKKFEAEDGRDNEGLSRSEDALVRQRAARALGDAAGSLRGSAASWRRTRLPPPTRENPSPPADLVAVAARAEAAAALASDLSIRLHGSEVLASDRVSDRLRPAAVAELEMFDRRAVEDAEHLRDVVEQAAPDDLSEWPLAEIERLLAGVSKALADRRRYLDSLV